MSETKFTKGPWAVHPVRAYVVPAAHISRPIGAHEDPAKDLANYAQEICAMHLPDPHRAVEEVRANAHLIAAAPDLYAALKDARTEIKALSAACGEGVLTAPILAAADAALAKARGETP